VWEWCQDWSWGYGYPGGIAVDPRGPDTGWYYHVIRGGGWSGRSGTAALCRSASRMYDSPEISFEYVGFRVALAPGQP
jgi:formylglycine-generating enzyme required for sulfatase activity